VQNCHKPRCREVTQVPRVLRWIFLLGLLLTPPVGMGNEDDVTEVRRTSQAFLAELQRQTPPEKMLRWFADEAFRNSVTRQITAFTGGDFRAPPWRIRQYVAETLGKAARSAANPKAKCPDPAVIKESLVPGLRPDNDPDLDGFVLKRVTRDLLTAVEKEAAEDEPQVVWLRRQLEQGRSIVLMTVACNDVPLATAWGRGPSGRWHIVAIAVPVP
jgi:hypothetical protein